MTTEKIDIDALADKIVERLQPTVPIEPDLWTSKEVAAYLKTSTRHVMERYSIRPDFPRAIRLPYSNPYASKPEEQSGKSHPRWRAKEVMEWALKHQSSNRKRPGASKPVYD